MYSCTTLDGTHNFRSPELNTLLFPLYFFLSWFSDWLEPRCLWCSAAYVWWWIVNVGVLVHVNVLSRARGLFMNDIYLFFLFFPKHESVQQNYFPRSFEKCVLADFLYYVFFPCPGGEGVLCCSESHGFHCVCDWDRPHLCPASLVSMWRVTCSSFALLSNMPTGTAMPASYPDSGTLLRELKVLSCTGQGVLLQRHENLESLWKRWQDALISPHM